MVEISDSEINRPRTNNIAVNRIILRDFWNEIAAKFIVVRPRYVEKEMFDVYV